jgi:hypothetical protein
MKLDHFITQVRSGNFRNIIVTGPQRSGTRIGAKVIADELNFTYTDETELLTDSAYKLQWFLDDEKYRVLQCPALCHTVHFFGQRDEVAIVLMWRDIDEIGKSEERIGWNRSRWADIERFHYRKFNGPLAYRKYQYWVDYQVNNIKHPFKLPYKWLKQHPLWVPKDQRGPSWAFTQTEIA